MKNLIAVKDLIKKARRKGIDLGKGDPYNRLRYYTKIGWLPHMVRKTGETGYVEGHYPFWALKRLQLIDNLKNEGLSNDEIAKKIRSDNVKTSLGNVFSFVNSKEKRNQLVIYLSFAFFLLVLLFETGVISGRGTKQDLINSSQEPAMLSPIIVASGSALMPGGEITIFVKSNSVTPTSKVYVTFSGNYSPASRYWVSKIVSLEGFYLELDAPVARDVSFSWWVSY